ncbi:uncharacterized protein P884DRAFT_202088 [Thermothelomyces heterothallicus CBS 202.75]|uniref:uncharacterized protein n=1 Tax=Thermothelomyces heterothallicus CBS 202.75 TaxID=1149848 RepID=UPI0037446D6A
MRQTDLESRNKVFLGSFVHSKVLDELEYLHQTAVFVDKSGTIVAIEKDCDESKARETVLPRLGWAEADVEVVKAKEGQFFFPGFIDTHIHAPQYPNAGIFGSSTLLEWLKTYTFPMEASLSEAAKARRVYTRVIRKTLSHGTTCAAYYATIDVSSTNLLADLCMGFGQRALIGRVCMDSELSPDYYRDASPEASIAATKATIAHIRSIDPAFSLIRPVITPRFAPACTLPLLRQLGALAEETALPVQTHISENKPEIALVQELFPRSLTGAADGSYAAVYDAAGLLTPRTVLAHAVHLTEGEADLVAARGAKVSHCPCSNSALTSGAAPVRRLLLDRGIACGLGTDVSGGYSASVLEAARQAALVSRHVAFGPGGQERDKLGVEEVLFLATRGGAETVGLGDKVGGFEVGMEWDAQLIGLGAIREDGEQEEVDDEDGGGGGGGNVDVFGWESWPERVAKWVYAGDDRNTIKVWVKGRLVHQRK